MCYALFPFGFRHYPQYEDGVSGPARVWLGDMDIPGLAMSRSIGDTVAHSAGVISTPEIVVHDLHENDKMIIVASDGLWEFMTSQQVVDFIQRVSEPKKAVDMLAAEASARWMKEEQVIDDTTIIVAYL
jgi:serine/threonine protein phosphatase PrpC